MGAEHRQKVKTFYITTFLIISILVGKNRFFLTSLCFVSASPRLLRKLKIIGSIKKLENTDFLLSFTKRGKKNRVNIFLEICIKVDNHI